MEPPLWQLWLVVAADRQMDGLLWDGWKDLRLKNSEKDRWWRRGTASLHQRLHQESLTESMRVTSDPRPSCWGLGGGGWLVGGQEELSLIRTSCQSKTMAMTNVCRDKKKRERALLLFYPCSPAAHKKHLVVHHYKCSWSILKVNEGSTSWEKCYHTGNMIHADKSIDRKRETITKVLLKQVSLLCGHLGKIPGQMVSSHTSTASIYSKGDRQISVHLTSSALLS